MLKVVSEELTLFWEEIVPLMIKDTKQQKKKHANVANKGFQTEHLLKNKNYSYHHYSNDFSSFCIVLSTMRKYFLNFAGYLCEYLKFSMLNYLIKY